MKEDGSKDKDGVGESQSPEARAFEEGLKKILQTPKAQVDKEMAKEKEGRKPKP